MRPKVRQGDDVVVVIELAEGSGVGVPPASMVRTPSITWRKVRVARFGVATVAVEPLSLLTTCGGCLPPPNTFVVPLEVGKGEFGVEGLNNFGFKVMFRREVIGVEVEAVAVAAAVGNDDDDRAGDEDEETGVLGVVGLTTIEGDVLGVMGDDVGIGNCEVGLDGRRRGRKEEA